MQARRSWLPGAAGFGAALLVFALTGRAKAQSQSTDRALAEQLFREGQSLVEAKRFAEACPKFAESQRLDPGTGTLLNLAACHQSQGKLASAWTEYSTVVTLAQRDNRPDRVAFAEERLKEIEPKLSRLTLELSPAADTPGLVIKLDGAAVGRPALGVAVPVDPGTHNVEAAATGKRTWQATVDIPDGPSTKSVVIPELIDAPPTSQPAQTAGGAGAQRSGEDAGNSQRLIAYVLGGAGVVGIGVGTAFGFSAISKNKQSKTEGCDGNDCTPAAAEIRKDAQTAGNASTVAFIAGGALLAAGVVVYLTAPSASSPGEAPRGAATLVLGPGSVAFRGTW
ncbi:MAG TPA: hypothetical protein VF103_03365 [Polyangiaceae bacterium]